MDESPESDLVTPEQLQRRLQLTKPAFERLKKQTDFPKPIRINARVLRWRAAEIETWLSACQSKEQR